MHPQPQCRHVCYPSHSLLLMVLDGHSLDADFRVQTIGRALTN